jgi:DNA-binding winged helix-turn-helix (wHTH) protein/TolB-like protein
VHASTLFRFGHWVLDPHARELRRDGARVRLQPQPLDVLRVLIERAGRIVERAELHAQLWPEGTFVDFDHGLNAAVRRLRAVLGDTSGRPRYIETQPRAGYRFVAPVECVHGSAVATMRGYVIGHCVRLPRVAILSFGCLDMDDRSTSAGFGRGLAEELATRLGDAADQLTVVSRSSTCVLQERMTAGELGRTTGARFVVEGSVRMSGGRVRIAARLVASESDSQISAECYERVLVNPLAVQSDVASAIAMMVVRHVSRLSPVH